MKKLNKQITKITSVILGVAFTFQLCAQVNEIEIPTEITGDSTHLSITNTGGFGSTSQMVKLINNNMSANQDIIEITTNPGLNAQFIEFQHSGVANPLGNINTDGSASFKGLNLGNIYSSLAPDIISIETTGDDGISIEGNDTGNIFLKLINNSTHEIYNESSTDDLVLNADQGENISFRDGNTINMNLTGAGNLGLGTVSPISKLDVHVLGFNGISVRGDGSSDTYLRVQNGGSQHYLFSDQSENDRFVLQSQSLKNIALSTGLLTRMQIDAVTGNIGIGTTSPDQKLHISGNQTAGGLKLENSTTASDWGLNVSNTNNLLVKYNDSTLGFFSFSTGNYSTVSDKRLKYDIKNVPSVIEKIKKLKPSYYKFHHDKSDKTYYGLIAQELKEVFPNVVNIAKEKYDENSKLTDLHTVSYTDLIPILIKGMQEQQEHIEEQRKLIEEILKD